MYSYSLFGCYILVCKNAIVNILVTSAQRRSKLSYDVIFVHLKKWEKNFFSTKTSFILDLKQTATVFFSILLWHLSNIHLSHGLIELVRVRTRRTSTLGVDHFKSNNFGIFDGGIRVRNEFFILKLVNVCH